MVGVGSGIGQRLAKRDISNDNPPMQLRGGRGAEVLTFLIADVRGYTSFTQRSGDEAAAHLAATFAEIAREGVEAFGGQVIELRGDEALAVFVSARQAIRASVELQQVFADEVERNPALPLRVGIGLDAGEAVPVEGGYRGGALNLAARLCSKARPGDVLASQGVTLLARAVDGLRFLEHGDLEMKGLDEPVRVLRVVRDGDDPDRVLSRLDAAASAETPVPRRSELPPSLDPLTPIVGREQEVRRLRWSWRQARQGFGSTIVVTGLSGIGKTRLIAEALSTPAAEGATVLYASFREPATDPVGLLMAALTQDAQACVVLDDLEVAPSDAVLAIAEATGGIEGRRLLLAVAYDETVSPPQVAALGHRLAGEAGPIRPQPLGLEEIRKVAALYLGAEADALPAAVLESTGGIPRRVHERVSDWANTEASRRLGEAATRAASGRIDLRAVEAELAGNVVDLQLVRERARLYGASPGRAASEASEPPFKGLASFDVAAADRFFGRERLVAELIARLAGAPLLAVVGPSGSGKSSAVRAGLVPALAAGVLPGSDGWMVVVMRPGEHPLRELDRAVFAGVSEAVRVRLAGADFPLRAVRDALEPRQRLVLVVDQFEEIFTACTDEAERRAFVAALMEAALDGRGNEVVVLAVRADFYGRCAEDPSLADLIGANHVLVGPMTPEEYRRAIEQPALRAGVRIESTLTDALVGEVVDEPGGLPLLSTALLELWDRRDGRTIRTEAYAATGGVRGAVGRLAEEAYGGLSEDQQKLARALMLRLAGPGEGDAVVRRRVPLAEFDVDRNTDVAHVLEVLTAGRLLTVSEGSVEVSHEALLREWVRFKDWLEEDRAGIRLRLHLSESSNEWANAGRDAGELYRGARLSSAIDWTTDHALDLNKTEREFLMASREANEREVRRLRGLLVGVGLFLVVALVAGGLALIQRGKAREAATESLGNSLGAIGVNQARLDRGLLLAVEGANLNPSLLTSSTLLATLQRSPESIGVIYQGDTGRRPQRVSVSPDGNSLAVTYNDNGLDLFDARSLVKLGSVSNAGFPFIPAPFSPDGSLIAMVSASDLNLIDVATRKVVRGLPLGNELGGRPVESMSFTPDGAQVVAVFARNGANGDVGPSVIARWRTDSGKMLGRPVVVSNGVAVAWLVDPGVVVASYAGKITFLDGTLRVTRHLSATAPGVPLAVSRDGATAAYGSAAGAVNFVDLRTGKVIQGGGGHSAPVDGGEFTADGRQLVTVGEDDLGLVWDVATHAVVESLPGHGGPVHSVSIDTTGTTAYTSSLDGTIFEWDLSGARGFGTPFHAAEAPYSPTLAVSPRGDLVAMPDGNGFVSVWEMGKLHRAMRFKAFPGSHPIDRSITVAFGPRGDTLAVGGTGEAAFWSIASDPPSSIPLAGLAGVVTVSVSPDGTRVAGSDATSSDPSVPGHAVVWDAATGEILAQAVVPGGANLQSYSPNGRLLAVSTNAADVLEFDASTLKIVRSIKTSSIPVAYSPDGNTLVTGGYDGLVRFWDPSTGRELGSPFQASSGFVLSVGFDPSGRTLITSGTDGTTRLFDIATRQQIGRSFVVEADWTGSAFLQGGASFMAFAANGRAEVWPATLAAWKDHACSIARRNLTRLEWQLFLPGRPYDKVCAQYPTG